jgi:hypothetical protein
MILRVKKERSRLKLKNALIYRIMHIRKLDQCNTQGSDAYKVRTWKGLRHWAKTYDRNKYMYALDVW